MDKKKSKPLTQWEIDRENRRIAYEKIYGKKAKEPKLKLTQWEIDRNNRLEAQKRRGQYNTDDSDVKWGSRGGKTAGNNLPKKTKDQMLLADTSTTCPCCGEQYGTAYKYKNRVLMRTKDVDHIYPKSRGGNLESKNLQILCSKCNRSKGDRIFNSLAEMRIVLRRT